MGPGMAGGGMGQGPYPSFTSREFAMFFWLPSLEGIVLTPVRGRYDGTGSRPCDEDDDGLGICGLGWWAENGYAVDPPFAF